MEYRQLGRTGLKVSRIGLGCMSYGTADPDRYHHGAWTLDEAQSRPFFQRALELGINFFDTADGYAYGASEEVLGRAIRDMSTRDEVVIATKVFIPLQPGPNAGGLSRKHIMSAIDGSLRRLGTDHVDLYQIHRWDYDTPVEETMEALHDVVRAGKALYLGASSMHAWQFSKANHVARLNGWTPFVSMQPQYNLIYREEEREMIPLCQDLGVGVLPWSPLARGFLAGRPANGGTARAQHDPFRKGNTPEDEVIRKELVRIADGRGVAPAQVALAWLASRPGVTAPIVGATQLQQLDDAVAALDIELTDREVAALEAPYRPRAIEQFR